MLERSDQIEPSEGLLSRLEVQEDRLAQGHAEAAGALRLVDPRSAPQTGQSHRSDVPQCGQCAEAALCAAPGLISVTPPAIPATQQGEPGGAGGRCCGGVVGNQSRVRPACTRPGFARDAQPATRSGRPRRSARSGLDSQRTGLLDRRAAAGAGVQSLQPVERELGQAVERLLGLESQGPVVTRPRVRGEPRCDCA